MKGSRKILIQIGGAFVIVFTVSILAFGVLMAIGSTSLFLGGKQDLFKKDLYKLRDSFESLPYYEWALEYWEEHPEEVWENMYDPDYQHRDGIEEILKFPYDATKEELNSLSDEDQQALGCYLYYYAFNAFLYNKLNYEYENSYLIDISDENRGFLIVMSDIDHSDRALGTRLDYDISDHSAVKRLLSGNYDQYEFELSREGFLSGERSYVGYAPITIDGKIKYAVCITYDWSDYSDTLIKTLGVMLVIGLVVGLITAVLLMVFVYYIAIRPLRKASDTVKKYSIDKDSETLIRKLRDIRSKNEVGLLTNEIAGMVEEIDRYNKEITTLATEKERVKAELEFAAKIQDSMLSKNFPTSVAYEMSALMDPAKEVGGDFYDFFTIDYNHIGLVIADVSGKGVPASLFMAMSMMNIRNFAGPGITPGETLKAANEAVFAENENKMFVTVWFGIVELSSGHVCAANAGHEYPIICKADGEFEVFKDKHGLVLGVFGNLKTHDYEFDLEPGDTLFVYTDGAPEATDKDDQMFGMERLVEALNKNREQSPSELIRSVHRSIDEFVGEADQFDDLTMLCFRYKGREKN